MTVIVGVEGENGACIAADSFLGNYAWKQRDSAKIFTRDTDDSHVIFGITGSPRWGQILQYRLQTPPIDFDDLDRYMAVEFSDAVRSTVEEAGYKHVKNGRERGGTAIIGVGGYVYTIYSSFEVYRIDEGYHAVGFGTEMAMGAAHVLYQDTDELSREETEYIAREAVKAACYHSTHCSEPVNTFWVDRKNE